MIKEKVEGKEVPFLLTPEDLLRGRHFWLMPNNQLLYRENGHLVITNISFKQNYSAQDFARLPEGAPYQLINQKLTFMASPSVKHHDIISNLHFLIRLFLQQNPIGKVCIVPLDVYLDDENVYQPDVFFVLNEQKSIIQTKHVKGVPNLTIEVLSESTKNVDKNEKLENYGAFGVQEYWIIDPENQSIEIYQNENHQMKLAQKITSGKVNSHTIRGFEVEVQDVFAKS